MYWPHDWPNSMIITVHESSYFHGFSEIILNISSQKIWFIKAFSVVKIHHSSKASILQGSAFFIVQLSHPYMTTGKTIALTRRTFVGKVMFLLFNMLSRLVITFLPRSKRLWISWLHSPSTVILEPKKIKSVTVSIVSPSICHEVMGLDTRIFVSAFYSPLSPSSRGSLAPLHFLP